MEKRKFKKKTIVALPVILIVSALVAEFTLIMGFLAFYLNLYSSRFSDSQKALYLAESCLYREIISLMRDRDHQNPISPSPCQVNINNTGNQATITVTVKYRKSIKKVEAILKIDQNTGKVTLDSWKEISI